MPVQSEIPLEFSIGEAVSWRKELAEHPASAWSAQYDLLGPSKLAVPGVADGDAFAFAISVAQSNGLVSGRHDWTLTVDDGAGDVRVLLRGEVAVAPDLAAGVAGTDARSFARRMVEAIEAVLEGRATRDQQSYAINGRSITRIDFAELRQARLDFLREARSEERREAIKRGKRRSHLISVRLP